MRSGFIRRRGRIDTFYHHQKFANVAQTVEQRIENPCVTGSIPVFGTNIFTGDSPSGKASDFDSDIRWFDPIIPCQSKTVNPVDCRHHVCKKSHSQCFIVNIIDENVASRFITVDAQMYLTRASIECKILCVH